MDNVKNISTMAPPKKKRKKVASLDKKKAKAGWWFIMPFLFGFITVYLPIVFRSIIYSISDKANANGKTARVSPICCIRLPSQKS